VGEKLMLEYKSNVPHHCDTGDTVNLGGHSWDCVVPCIVLGVTVEGTPVLQGDNGPELNTDKLVPDGMIKTPGKPGMTPTQVLTLGHYEKIKPEELAGTKIAHVRYTPWEWITITDDNQYVKHSAVISLDGEAHFEDDNLTMTDLHILGLVDESTIGTFRAEMKAAEEKTIWRDGTAQLKAAVDKLGKEEIIAMPDGWDGDAESPEF
jgi:hypothetical protein